MPTAAPEKRSVLREVAAPFIELAHAPRALWGVNLAYAIEGLCYFGFLTYLAVYFSGEVFRGVEHPDVLSHRMVMVLTAGIALTMVLFGFVADRWGARKALIVSIGLLLAGRLVISSAPTLWRLQPGGEWSALHLATLGGLLLVVLGYGIYQPAAYAAVRQLTTARTASMAYAMLYALMNLGSGLAAFSFLLRDGRFLGLGIPGTFWIYTALTLVSLLVTIFVLSRKVAEEAIASAKAFAASSGETLAPQEPATTAAPVLADRTEHRPKVPLTAWIVLAGALAAVFWAGPYPYGSLGCAGLLCAALGLRLLPAGPRTSVLRWIAGHPLADSRFFCFIFVLVPVQTLFTYNWLVLPQYVSRAYSGWIGEYYEIASNLNPWLIFVLVPAVTALTFKSKIYNMIVWGTLVMAVSPFILALGPTPAALLAYILCMTAGEAMWQARFLQYATEIAPEGRAGQYQGVAQLPWFLTKLLVPLLYSGWMMERYCPAQGEKHTGTMWLIFGFIAVVTPVALVLARPWLEKGIEAR
jgi:POT family proton-dependent oligopeptide transporter